MKKIVLLSIALIILTVGSKSAAAQAPSPMGSTTGFMNRQITYNSMMMNRMMTRRSNRKKQAVAKPANRKHRRHYKRTAVLEMPEPVLRYPNIMEKAAIV